MTCIYSIEDDPLFSNDKLAFFNHIHESPPRRSKIDSDVPNVTQYGLDHPPPVMPVLSGLTRRQTSRTGSGCCISSGVCITVDMSVVGVAMFAVDGVGYDSLYGDDGLGGTDVPSCGRGAGAVHRYVG